MTTAEKLNTVYDAFNGIKDAIVEKGGTAGSSITEFPQNILDLPSGGDLKDFLEGNITEFTVPAGTTKLGKGAFAYTNIQYCSIPESVTSLGNYCFYSSALTSIKIPSTIYVISDYCFSQCSKLASIEFSGEVQAGNNSFSGTTSLKSVRFPNTDALFNSYFTNTTGHPFSVSRGGTYYFGDSQEILTTIEIPYGITQIKAQSLTGGFQFTKIIIPNTVTTLGTDCFWGCSKLPSIDIPDSVTNISAYVFEECYKLKVINFGNTRTTVPTLGHTNAFYKVGNGGSASALNSYHIVVPDALYDEWITKTNWSSTTNYIKNNTIKYSDALAQGIITE